VNNIITAVNLRSVYRNDPVPTLAPHSFGFRHVGTEVHSYDCFNYLVYPKHTDDTPNTDLLAIDDHGFYMCLQPNNAAAAECNETVATPAQD